MEVECPEERKKMAMGLHSQYDLISEDDEKVEGPVCVLPVDSNYPHPWDHEEIKDFLREKYGKQAKKQRTGGVEKQESCAGFPVGFRYDRTHDAGNIEVVLHKLFENMGFLCTVSIVDMDENDAVKVREMLKSGVIDCITDEVTATRCQKRTGDPDSSPTITFKDIKIGRAHV